MNFVDLIARKRDGLTLARPELDRFIAGVTDRSIPDYQIAAMLMAIVWRGMTDEETAWLTDAMVRSGDRLDLSDIPGPKVGKHSTGGVGDKVSIVLAPVAAACGIVVPKMSGRGLGHTGGTIDKLESIPGFRVGLTVAEFKAALRDVGACIIGQTASLAPADKALYALRDVTATVESVPLISASIMSKKLAEGSGALVLDVKCGDGAFMKDVAQARALASSMVAIGNHAGVPTQAVITNMDSPLGVSVGNAIEIEECIQTLKGVGPCDLRDVVITLAARMVMAGGLESATGPAERRVERALDSGAALDVFRRMIERQGGDPAVIDDYRRLPQAPDRTTVPVSQGGFVAAVAAEAVGRASHALGAGRTTVGDPVDHAVGVKSLLAPGDAVVAGQPAFELHHRNGRGVDEALAWCREALRVGDTRPHVQPKILGEVT
jgi:pyrimidine-nucleoside phosphorylase